MSDILTPEELREVTKRLERRSASDEQIDAFIRSHAALQAENERLERLVTDKTLVNNLNRERLAVVQAHAHGAQAMSTPTQAHRCVDFNDGAWSAFKIACSCGWALESNGGKGVYMFMVNRFTDHIRAASRGSDEAADALIEELGWFAACQHCGISRKNHDDTLCERKTYEPNYYERAADALAALTGKGSSQ